MDLKQLEYIVEIAKERNVTHAAEKLFISQSALNQQLLKLEKELGTQIFHRNRTDWQLTEVGKIYVENAKIILGIQKEAYKKIYDCIEEYKGKLSIGLSPGRGIEIFIKIFKKLHYFYPDLKIEPVEISVFQQQEKIARGELDIGIMTLAEYQQTKDNYIVINSEEMVLITSKDHPFNDDPASKKPVNLTLFKEEPFVLLNKSSTNRDVIDKMFEAAGFQPEILFETAYTSSIISAVKGGLCCGIVPYYYAKKNEEHLSYFSIEGHPSWDIVISYKKGTYLSKPAQKFIQLIKEYFKK